MIHRITYKQKGDKRTIDAACGSHRPGETLAAEPYPISCFRCLRALKARPAPPRSCPSCGAELVDMRGSAFNIHQAAEAGLCVYIGDNDYTCSVKQLARDFR